MLNLSLILVNFPYVRNFAGSLFIWAQKPAEENWKRPMSSLVQHDCFKGRLSVVVPSRNEELNIPPLIENLQACYGEYIKEIIIDFGGFSWGWSPAGDYCSDLKLILPDNIINLQITII